MIIFKSRTIDALSTAAVLLAVLFAAQALRAADAPTTMPSTAPTVSLATTAPSVSIATTAPSVARATTAPTAPESATSRPSPEVLAIVDTFRSNDFSTRQAAQKKLVDMGQTIEPELRAILRGELSDEARARIQSAIRQIDDHVQLGAASITLHYNDAPLQTVLEDFARQAGDDMGTRRPQILNFVRPRRISIDLDHATFWQALQKIGEAGLNLRPYSTDPRMFLESAPAGMGGPFDMNSPHAQTFGPFVIIPQYCQLSRIVSYSHLGGNQSNLQLQLLAVAEPKIHVIGQLNSNWLQECTDDKGHALISDSQPSYLFNNGHQWWWQLQCNLKEVADLGSTIVTLRGELKFKVETKSELVMLDDLSKLHNITRIVAGNTVTLKDFSNTNGVYELHVLMTGPPAGEMNSAAIQDVVASIQLLGAADEVLPIRDSNSSTTPTTVEIAIHYGAGGMRGQRASAPRKLRWDIASETKIIDLPFELNNLDLPKTP